ncbi:MAG: site-specific integrase [Candidatus Binatia bacterium]
MKLLLNEFKQHLIVLGKSEHTASLYTQRVAAFLKHLAEQKIEKMTEGSMRCYIAGIKDRRTARGSAIAIGQFLKFSAPTQLAEITEDDEVPGSVCQEESMLPHQWLLEKLIDEKSGSDHLIATLGHQLMDHYLYFQNRIRGERENLKTVCRLADEARELIENNLALFMRLFSGGRKTDKTIPEYFDAAARRFGSDGH